MSLAPSLGLGIKSILVEVCGIKDRISKPSIESVIVRKSLD